MSVTPTVAIVGRPNVGKSTLFNRLLGRRKAIVHDQPGVTRDRVTGLATIGDNRAAVLVDTGGLVPGDDPLGLNQQVLLAVEESDLLIFMVDGKQGLLPADRQVWEELRRYGKPAVLAVNKSDTHAAQDSFSEFYGLGIDPQILISAEHGRGISGLAEALEELLPEREEEEAPDAPRLAIVGRPNVGKSSLLNRLVGEPRALVSPVAGTTRDPVDSLLEQENGTYLLIDTAGIRRRSRVEAAPEELAIMMARRQVERADLALLVIDAEAGVTTGDLAIAGTVWELGRAAVVVVNKWDLIDPAKREKLEESWPRLDEVLNRPRRVNVSALSARGVGKIFPAVEETLKSFNTQLSTSEINRMFEEAVRRHHAPSVRGKPWKLYYATQVRTGPPTFMLFSNHPLGRGSSYRRYLENRVTRELDLQGVPVRLVVRKRGDRE
jgi:GTP-binding protein